MMVSFKMLNISFILPVARFLKDNRRPSIPATEFIDDDNGEDGDEELVCKVPDETLFQLQQIHDALVGNSRVDLSGMISNADPQSQAPLSSQQRLFVGEEKTVHNEPVAGDNLDVVEPPPKKKSKTKEKEKSRKKDRRKSTSA
ncbi:unnamed protein product [Choristocarpus tenellus]